MQMSLARRQVAAVLAWTLVGGVAVPLAVLDCSSNGSHGPSKGDASPEGDAEPKDAGADVLADATVDQSAPVDASDDATDDATQDGDACAFGDAGEPLDLRCGTLYSDFANKTVATGVRQFDPGLHLWSDGAVKTRWIELPDGGTIDATNMDEWVFPVGTKFWKEFVLGGVRIETRLLWKLAPNKWYPTTYRWTADGESDATELTTGELNATDAGYEVPSRAKCFTCHQGRKDFVLGFEAVSLASTAAMQSSALNMATLQSLGILVNVPADAGSLAIPGTPVEQAALGYLHANCGTACHNRNPSSAIYQRTTLYMRLDTGKLGSVQATDTYTNARNQPTTGFGIGALDRIAACDLTKSCIYYRPSQRDGVADAAVGTQMPPIDTHIPDPTGLATIAAWINESCGDAGPADAGHD